MLRDSRAPLPLPLLVLILWVVSALYYLSYYKYGLNLWDEGVPLHGALRMMAGDFVYRDFYGYQPGIYWLYALSFKVLGLSIGSPRIVMAVLGGLLPSLTFFCVVRLAGWPVAILPTLAALVAPSCYYNRFFPILSILSLALITHYYWRPSIVRLLWIFVGGIGAYYVTIEIGVGLLVLGLVCATDSLSRLHRRSGWGLLLGTGLIGSGVIAPIIIYYHELKLDWVLAYTWHLLFNIRDGWSNPIPTYKNPESLNLSFIGILIEATWFWVPIAVYLITACVLLVLHRQNSLALLERRMVMITVVWGVYIYYLVFWRAGWGNLIRCLHPTYVLIGWASWRLWLTVQDSLPVARWLKRSAVVLLNLPLLFFIGYIMIDGDESAGAMAMRFAGYRCLTLDRAEVYCEPVTVDTVSRITDLVTTRLKNDAELLTIPLNPLFNFLTGNLSRSYHEWFIPGTFRTRTEEQMFVRQLEQRKVPLIIYRDIAIDGRPERRIPVYAPVLFQFLVQRYQLIKRVGNFMILEFHSKHLALDLITYCTLTDNYQSSGLTRLEPFGGEELDRAIMLKGDSVIAIDIHLDQAFQFSSGVWTADPLPPDSIWVTAECGDYHLTTQVQSYDDSGFATLTLAGAGPLDRLVLHVNASPQDDPGSKTEPAVWWVEPTLMLIPG